MATVTIDGLMFTSDGQSGLVYTRLQGWYSSPAMRASAQDRPAADGAFGVDRAYRSARVLTLEGGLFDSTSSAAIELWQSFAAIQSSGAPVELSVTDDFGTLSCVVSLDGSAVVDELTPRDALVSAQFVAYDPVKYAAERFVSTGLPEQGGGLEYPLHDPDGALYYGINGDPGRLTLTNAGTATTYPTFTITGGLSGGFFIQRLDTGDVVRYERVVPAGTDVTVDMRTGAVVVDGTSDGSTYLSRSEFFGVEPGASFDVQFNAIGTASGTPLMTAAVSDGFW